jgi:tetratricopeptide (TPR) repeat protein
MVWGMAWNGFKENPILGWGQENFNYVFNKYYNPKMWAQEQWFDRTHNIFFDWLISAGILGLLSYLGLFAALLYCIWFREARDAPFSLPEKSVLTGLLAAYFAHNFFVFDNIGSYLLFFSFLAFAHSRFAEESQCLSALPRLEKARTLYVAGAILLLLVPAAVYGVNARGMFVARDLISALKEQQMGNVSGMLAFYKKAQARGLMGGQETAEQLIQAAVTVAASPVPSSEQKGEFIAFAEQVMKEKIARAPEDARLRVFLGTFYNRLSRFPEAIPELEKAHELSPAKQTIVFELAATLVNSGRAKEGLALLREAYENAPEFQNARIAYAVSAIYAGELALAGELLTPIEEVAVTDERIVKAYYDAKRYDVVLSIWKARALRNPNDPQAHVSLGAAYLLTGERNQAIAELKKAIELNPAFKEQAEQYIREIRAGRNP